MKLLFVGPGEFTQAYQPYVKPQGTLSPSHMMWGILVEIYYDQKALLLGYLSCRTVSTSIPCIGR